MGKVKGDTARYHRERRKKLARRVKMRALRQTMAAKGAATPAAEAAAKPSGPA